MKNLGIIISLFITSIGYSQSMSKQEIIQRTIDIPSVQYLFQKYRYYNEKSLPFIIKENELVKKSDNLNLKKYWKAVLIKTTKEIEAENITAYIEIVILIIESDNIHIGFEYPIENFRFESGFYYSDIGGWLQSDAAYGPIK